MPEETANPESGANVKDANPSWDNPEGSQTSEGESSQPEGDGQDSESSAETLNAEQSEGQESQEGEGSEVEGQQVPWHKDPRWQAWQKEQKALREESERHRQRAEFYETHYNERFNAELAQRQGEQAAKPGQPDKEQLGPNSFIDPAKLPEGIKAPNKWENQEDIGKYINHALSSIPEFSKQVTQSEIKQAYEQAILPVFQSINQRFVAMAEEMMRFMYPDFEDMKKAAEEDIFTVDPEGKRIGIKNQALLDYINKDPIPLRAVYKHGLAKKAPQKIADGKKETTKSIIGQINSKPKGPTMPTGGTGGQVPSGQLGWNTPKEEAGKILHKRGVF